jgi:hypothetical protein
MKGRARLAILHHPLEVLDRLFRAFLLDVDASAADGKDAAIASVPRHAVLGLGPPHMRDPQLEERRQHVLHLEELPVAT